jgi:hypothetical protein
MNYFKVNMQVMIDNKEKTVTLTGGTLIEIAKFLIKKQKTYYKNFKVLINDK